MVAVRFFNTNGDPRQYMAGPFDKVIVGTIYLTDGEGKAIAERKDVLAWQLVEDRDGRVRPIIGMYFTSFEITAHEED